MKIQYGEKQTNSDKQMVIKTYNYKPKGLLVGYVTIKESIYRQIQQDQEETSM